MSAPFDHLLTPARLGACSGDGPRPGLRRPIDGTPADEALSLRERIERGERDVTRRLLGHPISDGGR